SFVEVYFPGYKWLPVIGTPLNAKASFSDQTQQNSTTQPSDDVSTRIFVPYETNPRSYLFQQIRSVVLAVLPFLLLIAALYMSWPMIWKAALRARRRSWAQSHGPAERIALSYA